MVQQKWHNNASGDERHPHGIDKFNLHLILNLGFWNNGSDNLVNTKNKSDILGYRI